MLFNHWGEEPLPDTAGRVGRTLPAVRVRLRMLMGTSKSLQGRDTVASLARDTGYDWHTIRRAMKALGLRPGRTNRKRGGCGRHMLQERHRDAILEWLGAETAEAPPAFTAGDLARDLDAPRSTVYAVARRVGVGPGHIDPADRKRIERELSAPRVRVRTVRAVAAGIRASQSTAYLHAKRIGIGPGPLDDAAADYLAVTLWQRGLAA